MLGRHSACRVPVPYLGQRSTSPQSGHPHTYIVQGEAALLMAWQQPMHGWVGHRAPRLAMAEAARLVIAIDDEVM